MITPNKDSTFIRVKSKSQRIFTWQKGSFAEVIEMIAQLRQVEKSIESNSTKGEEEVRMRAGRLDDLMRSAVDEALKRIFKKPGAEVIYGFLENKYHLRREDFAQRSKEFSAGLESLLSSAAPIIEKMILDNLYSKLQLKFEEKEDYGFSDYVKELKEKVRG